MANREDRFQGVDYYNIDDLLTEEHKLIRDAARAWVKKDVTPIIEEAFSRIRAGAARWDQDRLFAPDIEFVRGLIDAGRLDFLSP